MTGHSPRQPTAFHTLVKPPLLAERDTSASPRLRVNPFFLRSFMPASSPVIGQIRNHDVMDSLLRQLGLSGLLGGLEGHVRGHTNALLAETDTIDWQSIRGRSPSRAGRIRGRA